MEEQEMAVKKATVAETMAKVAAKSTETKAEAPKAAEKKTEAPKATEKKAPAKAAEKKTAAKTAEKKAPAKAAEKKAAPAKKATEKKAAPAKASQNVYVEYAGGQVSTADLVARATAASGKKSIKALNVYYQPETNMVYYTADGDEGSFAY
jgi:hypothetical protein